MGTISQVDDLRRIPLFAECSEDELATVARLAERRAVPAGSTLISEAAVTPELLVLVEGTADVVRCGARIATVGEGDFVGETSMLEGRWATASVVAATDLTVLAISRAHARALLRLEGVVSRLLDGFVGRLHDVPTPVPAPPRRVRRTDDGPVEGWGSITVAEQRVVDLVASGWSNPMVAEELFISRHTVESHLKSIYRKLGISSRTELAIGVAQHRAS